MVNPLTISSSHGVLSTSSATISPPPLKTWDTEKPNLAMKNVKTELYWIYVQHNNSPGLFFKKMDVLTTHRLDLGASQGFCEKLADNSSKCINEKHHKHSVSGTAFMTIHSELDLMQKSF